MTPRLPHDEVAGDQVWRELRWFDFGEQFAGRYVLLEPFGPQLGAQLKLHRVLFDDVDAPVVRYTYVGLPADPDLLARFFREVAVAEGIPLSKILGLPEPE